MRDTAKPLQPMAFKNLADLKRYIKIGTEFRATSHKYHPVSYTHLTLPTKLEV